MQVIEGPSPHRAGLGIADPHSMVFAEAVGADAHEQQHRHRDDRTLPPDAFVVGIEDEIRIRLAVNAARPPRRKRHVQLLRLANHTSDTDALHIDRFDDGADLARRDALRIAFGEHRQEGLLVPLRLRDARRLNHALPILRNAQRDASEPRNPHPLTGAVAQALACRRPLKRRGPDKAVAFSLECLLPQGLHHGAQGLHGGQGDGGLLEQSLGASIQKETVIGPLLGFVVR